MIARASSVRLAVDRRSVLSPRRPRRSYQRTSPDRSTSVMAMSAPSTALPPLSEEIAFLPPLYNQPRAPEYFRELVRSGNLGARTGRGFYDWSLKSADAVRAERDAFLVEVLRYRRKRS